MTENNPLQDTWVIFMSTWYRKGASSNSPFIEVPMLSVRCNLNSIGILYISYIKDCHLKSVKHFNGELEDNE